LAHLLGIFACFYENGDFFSAVTKGVRRLAITITVRNNTDKHDSKSQAQTSSIPSRRVKEMAKFYVQSGTLRSVIDTDEVQKAALWVVHRVMQQIAPIYDDCTLTPDQKEDRAMLEGLLVLDDSIRISEQGFDRDDATEIETFEAVMHWHQLMIALDKLEKLL
jgi:DNA mismatch repair ATPase MutS